MGIREDLQRWSRHHRCHRALPAAGLILSEFPVISVLANHLGLSCNLKEFEYFIEVTENTIAIGDFNMRPVDKAFQKLKRNLEEKGLSWHGNQIFTCNYPDNSFSPGKIPKTLDHMFTNMNATLKIDHCVVNCRPNFDKISDHSLLKTELSSSHDERDSHLKS